ncbi:hypothetical protein P3T17_005658 [Paraburkholderia sp. GAS82]
MPLTADDHGCPGWKGEMAERIRGFDWTATELGPIDQWQQSLVAAVQFVLGSPLPIVMLWGKQGYMVYNDAYAVFAGGRHPSTCSAVPSSWAGRKWRRSTAM